MDKLNIFRSLRYLCYFLARKQIIKLYGLTNGQTDGWCVKLYFLSLLKLVFGAQKNRLIVKTLCLSENIIVDLRIISELIKDVHKFF